MTNREKQTTALDRAIDAMKNQQIDPATANDAAGRVWSQLTSTDLRDVARIHGCEDVRALVPAFKNGSLARERALLVEDHLRECVTCRKFAAHRADVAAWSDTVVPTRSMWSMQRVAAFAAVIAIAVVSFAVYRLYYAPLPGVQASVRSVNGVAYRMTPSGEQLVKVGDSINAGETFRTGAATKAVLQLRDGSTVEVNERAEFSVDARRNQITVDLDRGNIIVQAAKRRTGHLYVAGRDYKVSVTGTVFAVNSGVSGTRVSVIEGEVHVAQNGGTSVLHPGDQLATNVSLESVPVEQEIAWSQNYDQHVALLAEFSKLNKRLENVRMPDDRYESKFLQYLPADTVLFAGIPNYGQSLVEANQIFQQQLSESEVLRSWWAQANSARHGVSLEEMIQKFQTVSSYLGNEVVVSATVRRGREGAPVIMAEVTRPGLQEYLEAEAAKVQQSDAPGGKFRVVNPQQLASLATTNDDLVALVTPKFVLISPSVTTLRSFAAVLESGTASGFTQTRFGKAIADSYGEGTGLVLAADLHTIMRDRPSAKTNQRHEQEFVASGFDGVDYLLLKRRNSGANADNRGVLGFVGERRGVPSWLAAPAPIGTLDFVSPDATVVSAFAVKQPTQMVDDLMSLINADGPKAAAEFSDVQAKMNIRLRDDLAAALGSEFTFAVDGPMLPVPSWKFIAEVYDPSRLQNTIEQFVRAINQQQADHQRKALAAVSSEQINGRTFYVIRSLNDKTPAEMHYTFVDGYLVAGASRGVVDRAIRTRESGVTLPRSSQFTALLPNGSQPNFSAIAYQNLGKVVESITNEMNPKQAEALRTIAQNADPTLVCAYGNPDNIVLASKGKLFGLDFNTMAIAKILDAGRGTEERK
jgi:predicted anti-sigma-YlaC factor YlaD